MSERPISRYLLTRRHVVALANEMEAALAYIRTSPNIPLEEKRRFYRNANRNLGSSALCLSGGASFGFCEHFVCHVQSASVHALAIDHFGVIKAFLDANLLPRVFNGTSAGTLAAGVVHFVTKGILSKELTPFYSSM